MKKEIGVLLVVFLLAAPFLVSAEDCGFFCQVGGWWNDFRGENVAGKAVGV